MILAQTHDGPLEVIVVDDGSRDGTATKVGAIRDPRIKAIRNSTSVGVAGARNAGLDEASHPWVAFCDDDDIWAIDKLERQLAALRRAGDSEAWCAGASVNVSNDWSASGCTFPPPGTCIARAVLEGNCIPGGGSGVLASTALVRRVGGFAPDLSLLADWDLWIKLSLEAPFVPVQELVLAYVHHEGSMSSRVEPFLHELHRVRDKFAGERLRLGTTAAAFDVTSWMASSLSREGRRVAALKLYLELALETRRLDLAIPMAAAIGGPALRARLSQLRSKDPAVVASAEAFISTLKEHLDAAQRATGLDGRDGRR